jgi:hypothetical protein
MAAQEPKITRLAPGEGAGSFKRKSGPDNKPGGGNTRNRTPKGQRRTQNPAILSDGSVDPKSKQYQRSVAGREKLEDYVKRLDAQGADERDIFMAAVNSLKNRGHGYVGAYLDSKNPSRRYNDVQAKAIADSVMSKANVGENPGARLTKPDKDTKEAQADKRAASKESGSAPEPGRKAMPVGQQRKQPGGRGGGAGMPETWAKGDTGVELTTPEAREREAAGWRGFDPAVSDAKRPELSKKSQQQQAQRGQKKEKGSKEDQGPETAAQRFQKSLKQEPQPTQAQGKQLDELLAKREEMEPEEFEQAFKQLMEAVKTGEGGQREALRQYIDGIKGKGVRAPLPGSSAAANRDEAIEKEQAAGKEQQELRQKQAQAGREEAKKRRQAEKEAEADRRIEEEIPVDEEVSPEEKAKSQASDDQIAGAFRAKYNLAKKYSLEAAIRVARENRQVAPKSVELDAEQIEYLAQETIEDLSEEFEVDPGKAIAAINKKFGLKIPVPEQEQPSTAPGPKTTTEQPQPPAEQATPPAPEQTRKPTPRQAMAQRTEELNSRAQQLVQENPEMDITEAKISAATQMNLEKRKSGVRNKSKKEPGLLSQLAKGTLDSFAKAVLNGIERHNRATQALAKKPTAEPPQKTSQGPSAEPKQMSDEEKLKEVTRLVKEEGMGLGAARKQVGVKPRPARRAKQKGKTSDSSEYQEFSDAVRQVVKLRSAQLVKSH